MLGTVNVDRLLDLVWGHALISIKGHVMISHQPNAFCAYELQESFVDCMHMCESEVEFYTRARTPANAGREGQKI
jgi:hypothetical protein